MGARISPLEPSPPRLMNRMGRHKLTTFFAIVLIALIEHGHAQKCVLCLVPQMDTSGDGLVQRTEVQEWITPRLAQLQSKPDPDTDPELRGRFGDLDVPGLVAEMLRMADENGDGSLSMDEVQSTLHQSEQFEGSALHDVLHFEML